MYANSHQAAHTGKGLWAGGYLDMGGVHAQGDFTPLVNPFQIPTALLEPQLLTDVCGYFQQS